MTGKEDVYRGPAIRALCRITDVSSLCFSKLLSLDLACRSSRPQVWLGRSSLWRKVTTREVINSGIFLLQLVFPFMYCSLFCLLSWTIILGYIIHRKHPFHSTILQKLYCRLRSLRIWGKPLTKEGLRATIRNSAVWFPLATGVVHHLPVMQILEGRYVTSHQKAGRLCLPCPGHLFTLIYSVLCGKVRLSRCLF